MKLNRQARRFSNPMLAVFSLVLLAGCGGKPARVSGTVSMDGNPLDQGTITFSPTNGGMRASGLIQTDGSYEIKTNRDTGLEVGEYDVAITARELIISSPSAPPMPGKYLVPKRYGRTTTSDLHYTVEKGGNTIDIDLTSEGLEEDNKPRRGR